MLTIEPKIVTEPFTLFEGAAETVLSSLPTRLASMVLTVTPMVQMDVPELVGIVRQLLRVTAGPVVILASEYEGEWAKAFASLDIPIRRAVCANGCLELLLADGAELDLPTDDLSISDSVRFLINQIGVGTLIDPFCVSSIVAVPTVSIGMKYVGLCPRRAKSGAADVGDSIQRALDGAEWYLLQQRRRRYAQ